MSTPPIPQGRVERSHHVLGLIRDEGPGEPFRRFLYRHGIHRRLGLLVNERPRSRRLDVPEDVVPFRLEHSDLDEYLALRPEQSRAEIEARLEAGHAAFGVRRAGHLIASTWLGHGRIELDYLDCVMQLAPDASHTYDDFVLPEHRRQQVLRSALPMRRRLRDELGLIWRVSTVLPENVAAFRRVGKGRPVFVGVVGRRRLGPLDRLFLRLDRELTSRDELPVSFADASGRPARIRRVEGPILRERAYWAAGPAPPAIPGSDVLAHAGLRRRRLLSVFPSEAPARQKTRVDATGALLGPEDLPAYLELRPDQDRAAIERRWRAGHVCFASRGYGRLLGVSWLAPGGGSFEALGCDVRLAPDVAGVYDEFVRPYIRRRHVLDPADDLRDQHARDRGWKTRVSLVPPDVRGAWLRMQRNGQGVVGELSALELGSFRRYTLRLEPGVSVDSLPCRLEDRGRAVPTTA